MASPPAKRSKKKQGVFATPPCFCFTAFGERSKKKAWLAKLKKHGRL
jgi:hypothetical protein